MADHSVGVIAVAVFTRVLPLEMQKRIVNQAITLRNVDLLLLFLRVLPGGGARRERLQVHNQHPGDPHLPTGSRPDAMWFGLWSGRCLAPGAAGARISANSKSRVEKTHELRWPVYTVQVGNVVRDLPIFQVAPGVKIAIFNMLGDTEVVEEAARLLARRLPAEAQVLVVPEVKAVPLGHALSVATGKPCIVVRKFRKPYMGDTLAAEVVSITTGVPQTLYLDAKDLRLIQGKKVALVDDVVSTGNTLHGLQALMKKANATVVGELAVFTEGVSADWAHIIALGHLPVFTD